MKFFVASVLLLSIWTFTVGEINETDYGTRIIGGQNARAGQFPFSAAIRIRTIDSAIFCGGALISSQWVLTAAHCVDYATEIEVTLGTIVLSEGNSQTLVLSSSSYHVHPDFNNETLENDIALVSFRQPIQYNDYVNKVYLPITAYGADVNVTAIGWGQTSDNSSVFPEDDLNFVQVVTISNDNCKLHYGHQIKDSMICISGQYSEGICAGDSGSPLIYFLNYIHPIAVGVASFRSIKGCETVEPSGYTRIFPYKEWILNITGPIE